MRENENFFMPKISVIMSAYNAEKYIKEAINSVLNQTFKDFEFIIINDGSTDSTKNIILSYKDSRIRLIENKENIGLTKSLNKGLRVAKGEYIARVDVDDPSMPERFEKQVSFLDRHKDMAVVGSWTQVINEETRKTYVLKNSCNPAIIKWAYIFKNQIVHSSSLFRKKAIKEAGYYNERYKYAQDFDLWFRVSRKYKMANIPKVLTKHRIHSKSVTGIPETHKIQKQFVLEIISNNVNYYINLNRKDFKVLNDMVKWAKISSFKNFIKARKIYKHLFSSYIRKENLDKKDIKKILLDYKKKQRAMFTCYIKSKFPKIYNLCKKFK